MHKRFFLSTALALSFAAIFLALFLKLLHAGADAPSLWLAPASISVQKNLDVSATPYSSNTNIDCIKDGNDCIVNTAFGEMTSNSTVRLKNTSTFHTLVNFNSGLSASIPIPNSDMAMTYSTQPVYGMYLFFTKNLSNSITPTVDYGTGLRYHLNKVPDVRLQDKNGNLLAADYDSLGFSSDGKWMIVSEPNIAILRVNLETFEVLPFGPAYNYTIGLSPSPKTAITNDGRFAIVASKAFSGFTIYDLSTCGSVPATITAPVACQSRSLAQVMQQQVPGYKSVIGARFISNDTLSIYANYDSGSGNKIANFMISSGENAIHNIEYLALGDSYISGEGAYSYLQGSDTGDNTCHISAVSYPYLIGQGLSYNSYHSVACSGAKVSDILDNSLGYGGQVKNKISRDKRDTTPILESFQPGYIDQRDFVTRYQPKVITISIGGNDIGFSGIIKRCVEADTCFSSYEDRVELVRQINDKFPELVRTYQEVKSSTAPDSRIYIMAYPQIAMPGGNCALNVHLNTKELDFSRQLISYLNLTIQRAADKAGVRYVDTENALNGHRLCETKSSDVAVNGLTAGDDVPNFLNGPLGSESYHPTALGHQLIEQSALLKTQGLTQSMPAPNPASSPPPEAGLEILSVTRSGRAINKTSYYENMSSSLVLKNTPWSIFLPGIELALKPLSQFQVILNSAPVSLGSYNTSANGDLSAQVSVPNNVEPGFHTLHIYGLNQEGSAVDINKTIYVAAAQQDINGNGVTNGAEMCGVVPNSNQDADQDGIDDSCDGYIGEKPPPKATQTQTPAIMDAPAPAQKNTLPISSVTEHGASAGINTPLNPLSEIYKDISAVMAASTPKTLTSDTALAAASPPAEAASNTKVILVIIIVSVLSGLVYSIVRAGK